MASVEGTSERCVPRKDHARQRKLDGVLTHYILWIATTDQTREFFLPSIRFNSISI